MSDPTENVKPGILYVDDEEKALKYFAKAFGRTFTVHTATNPKEGLEILEREAENIPLIVSDQRMPETTGVEFLTQVRARYPEKIRILTTAYSDLDSAIQSVNQGRIYQYVVKPWDLQELQMILRRAYDYYSILTERNELMAIKMSTFQRIVLSDRTKTLQLLSGLLEGKESKDLGTALYSLIGALPPTLESNPASAGQSFLRGGLRDFMQQEREAHETILAFWKSGSSSLEESLQKLVQLLEKGPLQANCRKDFSGSEKELILEIEAGRESELLHSLFGVLTEPQPSEIALEVLRLLPLLEAESSTLAVQSGGQEIAKFAPKSLSEHSALEEELSMLYDKWDSMSL
ncbi:response regulator [Puniceicoccus vermicola]|uniref:Response regulator n=1 Tax=Puniceicoccus vermicola TaxID=388746 RepID=A0A7X1AWM2_9BACT|nr:response regulator [Puniceicoccus vermicola]MBC2601360.1 response regulator [Puniceicoccus vermicola]